MKRRSLLKGIGAALALTVTGLTGSAKASESKFEKEENDLALFKRFFRVATGYEPNIAQVNYFIVYSSGKGHGHCYSPRQMGQTTLMMVLYHWERKVNGKTINIIAQNHYYTQALKAMAYRLEENLGKSVKDGKGQILNGASNEVRGCLSDVAFVTNDAFVKTGHGYYDNYAYVPENIAKRIIWFGTYETRDKSNNKN